LNGRGAENTGGRWLHAATRISLARLQAVAHRNAGGLPPHRGVARIDVFEC